MTDHTSSSSYRIEHLKSPDNYPTWSVQIKDILTESGLFGYADGTLTRPVLDDDGGNAVAVEAWAVKDAKALTAIRTRISQPMMAYVIGAESANEAWTSLKTVFDVQGPITITMERRKFARYSIPEGADIEEHVRILRSSKEKLTLLGEPLSERDFNLNLLTALPESWDSFISSIDLSTLADNSSTLIGRILQEDARRRSRSGPPNAFPAFQHQHGLPGPPGPPHFPNRNNQNRQSGSNGNRPQRHFGSHPGRGNFPNNRPNRPSSNGRRPPSSRFPSANNRRPPTNNNSPPAYSFMALTNDVVIPGNAPFVRKWIGDTGTQSHIVSDRALFETYQATPDMFISGVGSAKVLGIGTVRLHFLVDGRTTGRITLGEVLHVPSISHHLISLGRLTTGTGLAYFGYDDEIEILDPTRTKTIGKGFKVNHLYEFEVEPVLPIQSFLSVPVGPGMTGMSPLAT